MDREIVKLIAEAGGVAIFPHISADGDAIGSSLALALALRSAGKKAVVYIDENIPAIYRFLPGNELTSFYDPQDEVMDINIALDTGDVERLGTRGEAFFNAPCTINIDHHVTNTKFALFNYVDASAASTGEIIYTLLRKLKYSIDKDIAACLYTAVSTDTGGFQYSNTTAQTHKIAAELITTGIDIGELSQKIFESTTYTKLKLTQKAIEKLELSEDGRLAVLLISRVDLQSVGASDEDCDGIVNIGRSIEGVEVSIVIREKDTGGVRVNLRSKTYVDVSEIAAAFGGGGHKRAAGCTVDGDLQEVKDKIAAAVKEKLK